MTLLGSSLAQSDRRASRETAPKKAYIRPLKGSPISPREAQIMKLLVTGKSQKEIASMLGLSPGTVKVLSHRARVKMGVSSTLAIVKNQWEQDQAEASMLSGAVGAVRTSCFE